MLSDVVCGLTGSSAVLHGSVNFLLVILPSWTQPLVSNCKGIIVKVMKNNVVDSNEEDRYKEAGIVATESCQYSQCVHSCTR